MKKNVNITIGIISTICSPIQMWESEYIRMVHLHLAGRKKSRKYVMGLVLRRMNDTQNQILDYCIKKVQYQFPGLAYDFIQDEVLKQIKRARKEVVFEANTYE